jgi:hypothetical protein
MTNKKIDHLNLDGETAKGIELDEQSKPICKMDIPFSGANSSTTV